MALLIYLSNYHTLEMISDCFGLKLQLPLMQEKRLFFIALPQIVKARLEIIIELELVDTNST